MPSPTAARLRPAALVLACALLAGGAATAPATAGESARQDVRRTRALYADPQSSAARAARDDATFEPLARAPQALWVTGAVASDDVRRVVRDYADRANAADRTPLVSVYAIPDRDCGLYSSGGIEGAEEYVTWVRQVAAGLRGRHAMVVLEPDAVAFFDDPRCHDVGDRLDLLRRATKALARAGAWVYIDAGHSGWRSPEEMAPLLKRAGMAHARGFSTNVANFVATAKERDYARALTRRLAAIGVPGRHYVIETARNGARTAPAPGDVCNPVEARTGRRPRLVFDGALDGYVWVKHPGESDGRSADGTCHGGPPAGQWWPEGARRLLGD
ncbi:glycoside hydrolase family 6 protein [Nocardioides sp. MAHUQ-72]|uniref:glycoside hydrolase family 6 protein n=1 Tax=unclassified Nocardioides TaxID=2615069 RepID=UPI0036212E28